MIGLMNEFTDLPFWERKIFEADFTFEWKSAQLLAGKDVTRPMADWVNFSPVVRSEVTFYYSQHAVCRGSQILCPSFL